MCDVIPDDHVILVLAGTRVAQVGPGRCPEPNDI